MGIIYEPRGRAREYSALAVNLYSGCVHGCAYCYAPDCLRQSKESFHGMASVRKNVIPLLRSELKAMAANPNRKKEMVLLCFTSDPYQGGEDFNRITRSALELFREYETPFQILTKGGTKAARDFDLYSERDAFAVTLTFPDENRSIQVEPCAALPADRIEALRIAKAQGIRTWVSFEPVLDAAAVFELLKMTAGLVDLYKVGACSGNYSSVKDWRAFALEIKRRLEDMGAAYYIKNDLAKHLRPNP